MDQALGATHSAPASDWGSMRRAHTVARGASLAARSLLTQATLYSRESGGAGRRPRLVSWTSARSASSLRPGRGRPPRPGDLAAGREAGRRRSPREVLDALPSPARLRVEPEQSALLLRHADLDGEAEAFEVARHQWMVVRPQTRGEDPRDLARLRGLHVLPQQLFREDLHLVKGFPRDVREDQRLVRVRPRALGDRDDA